MLAFIFILLSSFTFADSPPTSPVSFSNKPVMVSFTTLDYSFAGSNSSTSSLGEGAGGLNANASGGVFVLRGWRGAVMIQPTWYMYQSPNTNPLSFDTKLINIPTYCIVMANSFLNFISTVKTLNPSYVPSQDSVFFRIAFESATGVLDSNGIHINTFLPSKLPRCSVSYNSGY
jgi:hypothetical protein